MTRFINEGQGAGGSNIYRLFYENEPDFGHGPCSCLKKCTCKHSDRESTDSDDDPYKDTISQSKFFKFLQYLKNKKIKKMKKGLEFSRTVHKRPTKRKSKRSKKKMPK